jgi:hypothetical protein
MGVRTFLPFAFLAKGKPAIIQLTRCWDYTMTHRELQSRRGVTIPW